MAKKEWIRQSSLAKELNITRQAIQDWVIKGLIDCKTDPVTGLKLVDKQSIKLKKYKK